MRSIQRMGEEWASPGIGVLQRMFSALSTSQRVGAAAFVSTPPACGPRNWGQLPADRLAAAMSPRRTQAVFISMCAFHAHLQPVNAFARGDEKELAVFAAKGDVGRLGFRHVNVLNLPACLVEDGHAVAGKINIALVVERHAVGTQFAEQTPVRNRAVL